MEKLRDAMGLGCLLAIVIIVGSLSTILLELSPFISVAIGIIVGLVFFYVINKLSDLKELERIHKQQSAFNKEFEDFKMRYAHRLESMPFLYPMIDDAQAHVIKFCEGYPDKYRNENDFKKATYKLIIARLNSYNYSKRYTYDPNTEKINSFIDEINRT